MERSLIACYHRVLPAHERAREGQPYFVRGSAIDVENFEAQLLALRERFDIVDEEEALRRVSGKVMSRRPFCWITFDDGYRDVLVHAAPVLRKLRMPATVFVPTVILDHTPGWLPADAWYGVLASARRRRGELGGFGGDPWAFNLESQSDYVRFVVGPEKRMYLDAAARDQRRFLESLAAAVEGDLPCKSSAGLYLTPSDLATLRDAGWSVGAHGHTHALMPTLDPAALAEELHRPASILAGLGHGVRTVAYPDGAWSPSVAAAVRTAGYQGAVTIDATLDGADAYSLPRLIMPDSATVDAVHR